jgi:tetratricopeptide (TPR) repeat protein
MLEQLSSLVDKSMVQCLEPGGEEALPRFRMLETLREFGLEQLSARQEEAAAWRAYTDYYLVLSEATEPYLQIPLLEQEHENVLNALQRLLATGQGEAAVRLSSTLWFFWWMRGLLEEGPAFMEQALATSGSISRAVRAKGLATAGFFASHYDNLQHAEALLLESTALLRELEDVPTLSLALRVSGYVAWGKGDYTRARTLVEEALRLSREHGDARGVAEALMALAMVNTALGACAQAWTQAEEGIALFVQFGDDISASLSRITLGWVAISQPDLARARPLVEEAVAHSRARNYLYNLAQGLFLLGLIVLWQGETATAEALFKDCLHLPQQPFFWSFMVL